VRYGIYTSIQGVHARGIQKYMLIFLYLKDLRNLFFQHCIEQLKKFFYARQYISMWVPVVARHISKRISSFYHVFISM
jgi:hypothetical protein